jgi:hypothetical protein
MLANGAKNALLRSKLGFLSGCRRTHSNVDTPQTTDNVVSHMYDTVPWDRQHLLQRKDCLASAAYCCCCGPLVCLHMPVMMLRRHNTTPVSPNYKFEADLCRKSRFW